MFITTSFQFFHYSAMFSLKEPICLSTQQSNQSQQHQFFSLSQSCCFSLWREQLMTKKASIAFSKVIFSSIIFIFTTKILLSEKLSAQHLFLKKENYFCVQKFRLLLIFLFNQFWKHLDNIIAQEEEKHVEKRLELCFYALCFGQ